MEDYTPVFKHILKNPECYPKSSVGIILRSYQAEVFERIVDSVIHNKGHTIVVIFPRQSGKNELQAQVENYLLVLYSGLQGEIVKISPTWKPQSLNAMRRLENVLNRNILLAGNHWSKEQGYIYRVNTARIYFLSGQPTANIVGATASLLLECDEAQDVLIEKWDKEIAPMAASTNATRVFWGTAWTSTTLLAREMRNAKEAQELDGEQRLFMVDAEQVGEEVPAYNEYVSGEIKKLGRNHPFIRTQYFSEMIDAEGGMFPPERQALMRGDHSSQFSPPKDIAADGTSPIYAFLIDVAGEDEASTVNISENWADLVNTSRDAHALTIVEVDLSTSTDELILAPRYLVLKRYLWFGSRHATLYGTIKGLVELWQPRHIVIDATGVGAGLASFLEKAYGEKVIRFLFNTATKSKLGWDFLAVIETGRFKDHTCKDDRSMRQGSSPSEDHSTDTPGDPYQAEFWRQINHCMMDISSGPNRTMKWGVPDGTRDLSSGDLVHDDLVISAAFCAVLDDCTWGRAQSAIIQYDPLANLGEVF